MIVLALLLSLSSGQTFRGAGGNTFSAGVGVPTNQRMCLNSPTNTVCFYFDGVNAHLSGANLINDIGAFISDQAQITAITARAGQSIALSGATSMTDDANAVGSILRSGLTLTNAAAKVTSFRNNNSEVASISLDGYLRSTTPEALFSINIGAQIAAGATTYGGGRLPPTRANTITALSFYTSVISQGAGTTTFTVTDGTNTCNFAIDCAAGVTSGTIGAKYQATTSGTCTFPASAALVFSSTSSTCATARPTITNLVVLGSWQ